ncbi:hypothetical protein BGW80DRAFT_856338 [Lactifluus volemus]|nr:hypothetical protein BGW80DRAFT_856338 [Lactifluus volemus]
MLSASSRTSPRGVNTAPPKALKLRYCSDSAHVPPTQGLEAEPPAPAPHTMSPQMGDESTQLDWMEASGTS